MIVVFHVMMKIYVEFSWNFNWYVSVSLDDLGSWQFEYMPEIEQIFWVSIVPKSVSPNKLVQSVWKKPVSLTQETYLGKRRSHC